MWLKIIEKFRERNAVVDILAILFGIGAWVAINALWVELPLLVTQLPEGWNLPSYISIVVQIANIGPITYSALRYIKPSLSPKPLIFIILIVGCVSSILLVYFWDETTIISGGEHSTGLLILVFFLSLVDCTSSVLYFPYMAVWKEIYFSSYLIGEGLSGFLPALVALGQGTGGNADCINVTNSSESWHMEQEPLSPNFSVEVFFYFIFAMMVCSSLAFCTLEFLPYIKNERSGCDGSLQSSRELKQDLQSPITPLKTEFGSSMSKTIFITFLCMQSWACFLSNGFLPSIQSYSCGPYGNVPYHLAATLSTLANPISAFLTIPLPRSPPKIVASLCLTGTGLAVYIIVIATMSPSPPMVGTTEGSVIMVLSWILFIGFITYVKVEISVQMREKSGQSLFWSGLVTQIGSALGSLLGFFLVNRTEIFNYYDPCAI